jgi:two-component system LytT family sensor kinase
VRHLALTSLGILAVWLLAGVFSTSEFYRRTMVNGIPPDIREIFYFQMSSSFLWAALTPLVIALAEALPIRRPHVLRNVVTIAATLPVIAILRAAAGGVVLNLSEGDPVSIHMINLSVAIRTHRNIFILLMIVVITNLLIAQRETAARERNSVRMQTLLAQSQLDQIRTQLQPHFLFTTLRKISTLIDKDPTAADAMLVRLSDLLRRSLDATTADVRLSDELDAIDRYLQIYKTGLGEQLQTTLDVEEDVLGARLQSALLQPLVERAVTAVLAHGGGAVHLRGCREGSMLRIDIKGEVAAGDITEPNDDLTITLTRHHLQLRHGASQSLTTMSHGAESITVLRIPLRPFAAADDHATTEAEAS